MEFLYLRRIVQILAIRMDVRGKVESAACAENLAGARARAEYLAPPPTASATLIVTLDELLLASGSMIVGDWDTVAVFVIAVPPDAVTVAVIVSVTACPAFSAPIVHTPVELA